MIARLARLTEVGTLGMAASIDCKGLDGRAVGTLIEAESVRLFRLATDERRLEMEFTGARMLRTSAVGRVGDDRVGTESEPVLLKRAVGVTLGKEIEFRSDTIEPN